MKTKEKEGKEECSVDIWCSNEEVDEKNQQTGLNQVSFGCLVLLFNKLLS